MIDPDFENKLKEKKYKPIKMFGIASKRIVEIFNTVLTNEQSFRKLFGTWMLKESQNWPDFVQTVVKFPNWKGINYLAGHVLAKHIQNRPFM